MSDLSTWLRARLDEDERTARSAGGVAWTTPDTDGYDGGSVHVADPAPGEFGTIVYAEGRPTIEQAKHIATFDPARVLAEVQARRAILDLAPQLADCCPDCGDHAGVNLHEDTVRLLAQPYAGRPGWKDEWADVTNAG